MAQHEPIGKPGYVGSSAIPDKLYFRIGEVASLCELPAYVLRFWESEFPQLRPNKGGTGQRLYRRRDVETALRIKSLLYEEGYTIAGARQVFKIEQRQKEPLLALATDAGTSPKDIEQLQQLKGELKEIHAILSRPQVAGNGSSRVGKGQPATTAAAANATSSGRRQTQLRNDRLFENLRQTSITRKSSAEGSDATHG